MFGTKDLNASGVRTKAEEFCVKGGGRRR